MQNTSRTAGPGAAPGLFDHGLRLRWSLPLLAALVLLPVAAHALDEAFYVGVASRILIFALAATSLNLILGFGGMVSFGHAAFVGVGAYTVGILMQDGVSSAWVAWPAAFVLGGLFAFVIGLVSLRTQGVYFIMITLAFAQMLYYFAISWPAYGGEDGLSITVRNAFPGLNTANPLSFFFVCYGLLMAALLLVWRMRDSRFGSALQAARQNETRVAAVGIRPYRIRLAAFVISAVITAVAGALFADLNRFVSPSMMSWQMSGELIVLIILGGTGRLFGAVAGAILYVLLEFALGGFTERWQLFLGFILLGVVLFARGGIVGLLAGKVRHG